jgi:hypothetical protein
MIIYILHKKEYALFSTGLLYLLLSTPSKACSKGEETQDADISFRIINWNTVRRWDDSIKMDLRETRYEGLDGTGSPRDLSQLNLGNILFIKGAPSDFCLQIFKLKFCFHFSRLQHLFHIPLISPSFIFFHFIALKMFRND